MGLIVAIWIRLIRLIGEKKSKVLERGPITKIKIYNNYKKINKNFGSREGPGPLGPPLNYIMEYLSCVEILLKFFGNITRLNLDILSDKIIIIRIL